MSGGNSLPGASRARGYAYRGFRSPVWYSLWAWGAIAKDGLIVELVRRRRLPVIGDGAGIWSFIHVQDVARATMAAMSGRGAPGIYNVVDDEPAAVSTWLPFLASAIGAKPPRKVPVWLGRLVLGAGGVSMMTKIR